MEALNEEYLQSIDEETRPRIKEVMSKYGENYWWLSDNPEVVGYYQLKEEILLVDFQKFHEGIEKLLDKPVWTLEFSLNYDQLVKQAEEAWVRKGYK